MKTYIYLVRHGESPKTEGNERTRGLTAKGLSDANRVTEILQDEGIDIFISSPYRRAILTIDGLAKKLGKDILVCEDLRELVFVGGDKIIPDQELYPLVKRMFSEPDLLQPAGESISICRERSMKALKEILNKNNGNKIVIGIHGLIMTLMLSHFDENYGYDFLFNTSKPDIYRMEFENDKCLEIKRCWTD